MQNVSKLARCLQEGVGHLEPRFQGEGVVPVENFLVSTRLVDTFCYQCKLHHATCRRFDTIPACDRQTDRQTDGQTDGIAELVQCLHCDAL